MLCAPGATVVWTRHTAAPDLNPSIRGWLDGAGFRVTAFDDDVALRYGVGAARLVAPPPRFVRGVRLFAFG